MVSCSCAAQLHKQSCAKLSRCSTRPSFARLWLLAFLVLETFALGTLRLECDSVLPLCRDTILFHWIIQSRSGRRTHCMHFEASYSQHCPREAAVFGFWEEPAWVLLYCAFKVSSSSDSHFAIKRSWSNSAGSKTLHALEKAAGLRVVCKLALMAFVYKSPALEIRYPDRIVAVLERSRHYEVDLFSRQKRSACCEVCKLHQVRVRSNVSPSPVEPALRRTNRFSSRRSTPIPTIFVHNHLAALLMEPRMDDAFDTAFPGRQFEFKAFSKKDESVITRVTKTSARCFMSLAILPKFVKHL